MKTYIKPLRSVKIYCWNGALFQTTALSLHTDVRWKRSWSKSSKSVFFRAEFSSRSPSVCIHFFVFLALTFLQIAQFTPSCLPLPARLNMSASVQWGCVSSVLPQAQRSAGAAGSRSCLLAETDTGTRLRLSSYSNPVSLWSISSNLFLSALSITSIRILVFSKELPQLGLEFLRPPVSVLSVQFKAL